MAGNQSAAWLLLLIGALSDIADGWLARLSGGGSEWGARLDPLADKIILIAPYIWLAKESLLPMWGVWLVITRELIVSQWRSSAKKGGPASKLGKSKTILQFTSLLLLLWPTSLTSITTLRLFTDLGILFFWISIIVSYISGYFYIFRLR